MRQPAAEPNSRHVRCLRAEWWLVHLQVDDSSFSARRCAGGLTSVPSGELLVLAARTARVPSTRPLRLAPSRPRTLPGVRGGSVGRLSIGHVASPTWLSRRVGPISSRPRREWRAQRLPTAASEYATGGYPWPSGSPGTTPPPAARLASALAAGSGGASESRTGVIQHPRRERRGLQSTRAAAICPAWPRRRQGGWRSDQAHTGRSCCRPAAHPPSTWSSTSGLRSSGGRWGTRTQIWTRQ